MKLINIMFLQIFTNTIALALKYEAVLDGIYNAESLTLEMEAPDWLKKAGATAKSVLIPKVTTEGMKNYSRSTGFLVGDNTFEWETHTYSIDRGIEFSVDKADNMETIDAAFAFFSREFMRNGVVPEIDAYRFATLAGRATDTVNSIEANLTKDTAMQAWDDAMEYIENTKVNKTGLLAYMSPTFKKYLKQSNLIERQFQTQSGFTAVNREVDALDGIRLKTVPQDRFYTVIDLQTGEDAGYIKNVATGKDINFMIVDPMAALGDKKIDDLVIFDPMINQSARAWKFQYRCYHDIFSPDNKVPGIYVHRKTT